MSYEDLKTNWTINHRNNDLLLDFLTDDLFDLTSRPRGRSVKSILAHLIKNKYDWLSHMSPKLDFEVLEDGPLKEREQTAYNWVSSLISAEEGGQTVKGFKSNLFGFVIYLISHDSHHRGQIFQILRDNKVKLEPSVQFGIWDWKA